MFTLAIVILKMICRNLFQYSRYLICIAQILVYIYVFDYSEILGLGFIILKCVI